jgi:hypothetical protein
MLTPLLFPKIFVMETIIKFLAYFGLHGNITLEISWFISQLVFTVPFILLFYVFLNFQIKSNELKYLRVLGVNFNYILKTSFLRRFFPEYVLSLIITTFIIINEGTINSIYSDVVPSFTSEFIRSYFGRGINEPIGDTLFAIQLLISLIVITIWNIQKVKKKNGKIKF